MDYHNPQHSTCVLNKTFAFIEIILSLLLLLLLLINIAIYNSYLLSIIQEISCILELHQDQSADRRYHH